MTKTKKVLASVAALAMIAGACSSDDDGDADDASASEADSGDDASASEGDADEGGDDASASEGDADEGGDDASASEGAAEELDQTQSGDITLHMITHSDGGPFWSVVKRGQEAACSDLGVDCVWLESVNDPGVQVQLIEQAVSEGSSGIAASLPSPDQLVGPLQAAVGEGIPVITLNSGVNQYQDIGALTHVGQTEFIAGQGAGNRFNDLGATKILCGRQEESNVALEERCDGLADTFSGEVISEFVGPDADQTAQQNAIAAAFQADPDIDGFMGTGPVIAVSGLNAANDLGLSLAGVAGFDITPEIITAIDAGEIAFTVDQQQYLQGYLPMLLLYLNVTNLNTAGGGQPILTGPGFVTPENAAEVSALVDAGTR